MFYQATDYETAGQNKLALIRYYNSMAVPDTYATSLGRYWRTNYDRYLHIVNPSAIYGVVAERPDGAFISFTSNSGTYTPDSDVDMKLTVSGSTWTLTTQDDTVETYTQSGSKATLQSIKKRGGYTQALGYSGGQISYVSDSYSRQLGFSYTGGLLTGVTTPDSLALTYAYSTPAYSSASQLTSVTYNTSPATHQTYLYENSNYPLALTGITDENGKRYATWGYDSNGRGILSQLNGAVNYTSVYYNDTNGNRVVKGPLGIVETYKFSTLQGVPKVTEIDRAANGTVKAATETFAYDTNGFLKKKVDWNGNITAWTNNSRGLPTQIVYASTTTNAQTTNITYDFWWPHLQHTVATNGLTESFTYSSSGNMLTRSLKDTTTQTQPYSTNGQTRTWTYTYTGTGQLLTAQLPRTDVTAKTTYGYTGGTLTSITDALGHVTAITQATGGGYPKKIRDMNSVFTTLSYTPRLWLSSSVLATSAGNLTTSFTYDSAGNLTKQTFPDNSALTYAYDTAHRPTSITDAVSSKIAITYDSAGDLTQQLWKDSTGTTKRQHTATYDALGRMLTSVGGMSQTTSFTYDKNGNIQTITDPLSHVRYQSVDQLNRLTRIKDAKLYVSTIAYDSHSRPLTFTDPKGNKTTYVYDGFGDMIQRTSPDTLKTIFYYDKDYNLTGTNRAGIKFESASYDKLDRQTARTYVNDSSLNVSIYYDSTGHGYGVGRLTGTSDQAGTLSRSYDARGLVTSDVRNISSSNYTSSYTYNSAGRYSSITYASSSWLISYTRDAAGQITAMTQHLPGHSTGNVVTTVKHLPFGPASSWTYGNGMTDARTFDLDYRMTSVKDAGTSNIQYVSYGYDADNNLHTLTDNVTPANNKTFSYDEIDRLTNDGGSITYDSNSNILSVGGQTTTVPATSDRMSAVGTDALTYDNAGNVIQFGPSDFNTYSQANRLATAINGSTTAAFRYDAFGRRIMSTINGSPKTNIEIYDLDGHLITETNNGVETDYAYLDGLPILDAAIKAAKGYALHTDRQGTVTAATDSSKVLQWQGAYATWGAVIPSPANITQNLRFPGMHEDATSYYHNGARDYDPWPNVDHYPQPDPIGLNGYSTPFSNPYVYAGANPFKYTDPSGLCPLCLVIAPEAVEALSAGVADVVEALEANEALAAAEEAQQAAAQREAAENAANALRQLSKLQPPSQTAPGANPEPGAQCTANTSQAPNFIVNSNGTVFPVPQGAQGPVPVINPAGNQTGWAFVNGNGGENGQVSVIRLMNPTGGRYPAPNGYVTYSNGQQAVDPYTGQTVSRSEAHFLH